MTGLDELRQLVAEEMFLRWQFPPPAAAGTMPMERYLTDFAESIWVLVAAHPGIAPYLLRGDMITPAMIDKIVAHQVEMGRASNLSFAQSRWLLLTIAFHCVAVADVVLPRSPSDPAAAEAGSVIDPEHANGIRALILGTIAMLPGIEVFPYPVAATAPYDTRLAPGDPEKPA